MHPSKEYNRLCSYADCAHTGILPSVTRPSSAFHVWARVRGYPPPPSPLPPYLILCYSHTQALWGKGNIYKGGIFNIPCHPVNSLQNGSQYQERFDVHYNNFVRDFDVDLGPPNRFGQDCYDATWILALALNNTITGTVLQAAYT